MTHLIEREEWTDSAGVKGLAYFCGVLDHRLETPAQARERVKDNAEAFLENHIGPLWPKSLRSGGKGGIRMELLANPGRGEVRGPARLGAQYFRANTRGSELYVLTPKGSVENRLAAGQSGIDNLYLAGDWTKNGVDGGCVEAAMASGVHAAGRSRASQKSWSARATPGWPRGGRAGPACRRRLPAASPTGRGRSTRASAAAVRARRQTDKPMPAGRRNLRLEEAQ